LTAAFAGIVRLLMHSSAQRCSQWLHPSITSRSLWQGADPRWTLCGAYCRADARHPSRMTGRIYADVIIRFAGGLRFPLPSLRSGGAPGVPAAICMITSAYILIMIIMFKV
jgi:hypothetical protein